MSLLRHNPKRDKCEQSIVNAFRELGCTVWRLDEPADLLVATPRQADQRSTFFLVECKTKEGTLTPKQADFHGTAWEEEWPVYLLYSESQVLECYNKHQRCSR